MDPHLTTLETGALPGENFFFIMSNLGGWDFEPANNAEILDWPINLN